MSVSAYFFPIAVYWVVVAYMAWCYGKDTTLRFRGLLGILLWPLDLVWPFVLAGVAVLEVLMLLVGRRLGELALGQRSPDIA